MKCSNCQKGNNWLEVIGFDFICKKCIQEHKIMGNVYRTHINTFHFILKKLNIKNYSDFRKIKREQIDKIVNLKKIGVKLKTTNVIDL
jgi:hypothetical protein